MGLAVTLISALGVSVTAADTPEAGVSPFVASEKAWLLELQGHRCVRLAFTLPSTGFTLEPRWSLLGLFAGSGGTGATLDSCLPGCAGEGGAAHRVLAKEVERVHAGFCKCLAV